jgi:sugar/nucleoside kinase (ribokinase family)
MTVFDLNYRPTVEDPWTIAAEWGKRCTWFKASIEDIESVVWIADIWSPSSGIRRELPPTPLGYFFSPGLDQRKLGILTRGAKGCDVLDWQRLHHERGVEVTVADTVGAGDAFLAAFLCSHLEGRPLKTTMRFALHYAGRVCSLRGATPRIDRDEIEIALLDDPWMRDR